MKRDKKGVVFVIFLVLLMVYVSKKNATSYNYEDRYRDSVVAVNAEINTLLEKKKLKAIIQDSSAIQRLLASNCSRLALRLTDSQCDMCIDMQYLLLSKYMQEVKQQLIVVGTQSEHKNYKGHKFVSDIVEISDTLLAWEPEFYNTPYYFMIHPDGTVSHFFVPDKNYEELTKSYFEEVRCSLVKNDVSNSK